MENKEQKEALQYVASMALTASDKRIVNVDTTVGKRTFAIDRDGDVVEFRPHDGAHQELNVHTLGAIIDYITHVQERPGRRLIVEVVDEGVVKVYGELDRFGERELLLVSEADRPQFPFAHYLDREAFNIALQSQFVANTDQALLLKFVGNMKEEATKTSTNDGVTQVATVKTGVASVSDAIVPNPVTLAPFRTFSEIAQPESGFVFRVSAGMQAALFEADGGQWRNEAIRKIADYLTKGLAEEMDRVTILA